MKPCISATVASVLLAFTTMYAWATTSEPDAWKVVGVETSDTLRMHASRSARSRTIGHIPHNADRLKNLGCRGALSFGDWQRARLAERQRASRSRWCKVAYGGRTGWVAGRYLAEGGTVSQGGKVPENRPRGGWSVRCDARGCAVEQVGVGAAKKTLLRIEPLAEKNARIVFERPDLPRTGMLSIFIDGEQITGGPIDAVRDRSASRLVFEPDDITAGLIRKMQDKQHMVLSFPGEDRGVEFMLAGFGAILQSARSKPVPN